MSQKLFAVAKLISPVNLDGKHTGKGNLKALKA